MERTHKLFIYIDSTEMQEVSGDYESIMIAGGLLLQSDTCNSVRVVGMENSDLDATYEYSEDMIL